MQRKTSTAVGVAAAATTALVLAPGAQADELVASGVPLDVGDRIEGTAATATASTSIGNVTCASNIRSTVTANPGAGGGHATLGIDPADTSRTPRDAWTLSGCTDTIPYVVINGATLVNPVTATLSGSARTASFPGLSLQVSTSVGMCTYSGNLVGDLSAPDGTLGFDNDTMIKNSGSSLCPGSKGVTGTYDLAAYDASDTTFSNPLGPVELYAN